MEFLSGNTHGIMVILIDVVAGILVDLGMLPFRNKNSYLSHSIAGGLAAASNVFVFQAFASIPILFSPHAYQVAERFRAMGKIVIGGGKFASTFPDEVQPHFDSILVGEAQTVWAQMVYDMVEGKLKKRYDAGLSPSLEYIPPPRYDLVERKYFSPIVTEATRGCPHPCTYCQLNIVRTPHRMRPIKDVVRDLTNTKGLPWFKRKMAMLLDNNLGGDLKYAKDLLREIAKLKFWGIGAQYSIECLRDDDFVEALAEANCRMSFLGMESLNEESLRGVQKKQNKVEEYKEYFDKLNRKGILTFTGLMFALDEDTKEYYETLPEKLDEVGCNVILPSISIPIYGTPLYDKIKSEGRLIDEDISHYEGDHVLFRHNNLTEEEIYEAYKRVNKIFYSWKNIFRRWIKFVKKQSVQESVDCEEAMTQTGKPVSVLTAACLQRSNDVLFTPLDIIFVGFNERKNNKEDLLLCFC